MLALSDYVKKNSSNGGQTKTLIDNSTVPVRVTLRSYTIEKPQTYI